MAFSSGNSGGPMADINVTPLVDVMLVLLIIFMITAPMLSHKIKIDLPQPNPNVVNPENPPDPVRLQIRQDGSLYWNDTPVDELGLKAQIAVIASSRTSRNCRSTRMTRLSTRSWHACFPTPRARA